VASWKVVGLSTDHTQSIQISVKDFIKNNWTLTGELAVGRIKFGTGWYDKNNQYQIHVRSPSPPTGTPFTIGKSGLQKYDRIMDIHFFVTKLKSNVEPAELDKMYNETDRIIGSDRVGLETSQGICAMWFIRAPYTLPQPDSEMSTWHGIGTLRMFYYKQFI